MNNVFLLNGSNIGNRLIHLRQAARLLNEKAGKTIRHSAIYETESWGIEGLPTHYNQALELQTDLNPIALLEIIHRIEYDMGRIRDEKWGVRPIDIDIIYFNDIIFQDEALLVPHALMQDRKFVLVPLVEIAPDFVHPVLMKTNKELLMKTKDVLAVHKIQKDINFR